MYWDQITENLEGFAKDFGLYPEAEGTSKISKQGSINNYIWKDGLGTNGKNTMIDQGKYWIWKGLLEGLTPEVMDSEVPY